MRTLFLTLCLLVLCGGASLTCQDAAKAAPSQAQLEELWKTGSLWQVGDNIPKVDAARKALIDAGDAGLNFVFTKLGSSDSLQYRCLEAVFKGFGAKALPGLLERVAHEEVQVRRNVAALLGVIDDKSAAAKMVAHLKTESDLRCKVGHLQTLARWKEPAALDPLIECTRVTQDQEPLAERLKVRIVPLLGNYEGEKALARLVELLEDPAYFVRDAARDALKGSEAGIAMCRRILEEASHGGTLKLAAAPLLLSVCAASRVRGCERLFLAGINSESGALRAKAASCLRAYLGNVRDALKRRLKDAADSEQGVTEEQSNAMAEMREFARTLADLKERLTTNWKDESDPAALEERERLLAALDVKKD